MEPIPQISFQREINRILQEPSLHLRGVALHLQSLETTQRRGEHNSILSDLKQSEAYLKKSGDPIQLAKTHLELARLALRDKDLREARKFANAANKGFSGYSDIYYPDDLRHLLSTKSSTPAEPESRKEIIEMFINMVQELVPSTDFEKLLSRTVAATNRFFGAERGGIFWFEGQSN